MCVPEGHPHFLRGGWAEMGDRPPELGGSAGWEPKSGSWAGTVAQV